MSAEQPQRPAREPLWTRVYNRGEALVGRLRRRLPWLDHLARANERYQGTQGDLMAAGVTYFAFLGLFPVLLLAASIFGLFLAGDALLQQQLYDSIREAFPGELGQQLVHEVSSAVDSAGVTGLLGLAGFLYAGLRTVDKLRIGMELIWKGQVEKPDVVRDNLQDLVALVALGGIGVVSLALTGLLTQESSRVLALLGLVDGGRGILTRLFALALAVAVDVVIFLWLLRVVPSVSHPLRRLLPGALFGAAGFEALKLLGGYYLTLISGSVTASAFGGAVGLLVWINLLARFSFFTAAWTATLRSVEAVSPVRPPDAGPVAA